MIVATVVQESNRIAIEPAVVAFHSNIAVSKGTKNCSEQARKMGIKSMDSGCLSASIFIRSSTPLIIKIRQMMGHKKYPESLLKNKNIEQWSQDLRKRFVAMLARHPDK